MTIGLILLRNAGRAVAVGTVVLSVAACGVKSAPAEPGGGNYSRQHPAPGAKTEIGTSAVSGQDSREETAVPRSPLGFPLEYPNSPTYK